MTALNRRSGAPAILLVAMLGCCTVAAAATNSFSGHVFDATSGAPLVGATVLVGNDSFSSQAATDTLGYYEVSNVPVATDYTIVASALGHASQDLIMQTPPAVRDFYLVAPSTGYLVDTLNQGLRHYEFNGTFCYRTDGTVVADAGFFPDIDAQNANITSFLAQIGAGTNPTTNSAEIWGKCAIVWEWLRQHASYNPSSPGWQAAMNFMMAGGWPSIDRIALTYQTYGFVPWGTCMSRSQLLTTLLYRVGIPKDRTGIAETRWKLRYSQHMYTIVRLAERWVYLDATFSYLACPDFAHFASVPISGGGLRDYGHPYNLDVIPGAGLTGVPEVSARASNSPNVFLAAPPPGTRSLSSTIDVAGFSENAGVTEVLLNGTAYPVSAGAFSATVPLSCGPNVIAAQVTAEDDVSVDAVTVTRWCAAAPLTGDLNCDGAIDFDDINPFVAALSGALPYYAQFPDCNWPNADCNADGAVDFDDINPFVAILAGG